MDQRLLDLGVPIYDNVVDAQDIRLALGKERYDKLLTFLRLDRKFDTFTVWEVLEFLDHE